jgi:hypothetical protein
MECTVRPFVSTLNNVWWIWTNRTARADIVASLNCVAVILLQLSERKDRNLTRLAMVTCALRYCLLGHRQTIVQ